MKRASETTPQHRKRKFIKSGRINVADADGSDIQGPVVELHLGMGIDDTDDLGSVKVISSPPPLSLSPTLDDLLGVGLHGGQWMTSNDFLKHYFPGSRAVYVNCGCELAEDHDVEDRHRRDKRVSHLVKAMHNINPEKILRDTSSDNIFVWLMDKRHQEDPLSHDKAEPSKGKIKGDDSPLIRSIECDADTALALYKAGHATYCRAPPEVEQQLVASLLKSTGLGCGQYDPTGDDGMCLGRGEVETFLSKRGHTTSWHFDFQQNFTIQLSGTKAWTLQEGTITHPLRGCTPHYSAPGTVESQLKSHYLFDRNFVFSTPTVPSNAKGEPKTVVLRPGDVLFFPAGMWHKVETLSDSVSINVSLMATNYAHAVSQALYHFLYSDPRFRQPITSNSETNAVDHLRQLMLDLPQIVSKLGKDDGSGAEDILPPILRFPPCFQKVDTDSDDGDGDGDDNDDDSNVSSDHESFTRTEGERVDEDKHHEHTNNDDSDIDDDDKEVIDPSEFVSYPERWGFELEIGSTVELLKNPLSALHKLHEITDYYRKIKSRKQGTCRAREAFVLNVNYGGNEMQASAIRVAFLDNSDSFTELLWQKERAAQPSVKFDVPLHVCAVTVNNHYLISFLAFHGYIQVRKVCKSEK
jgi:Cupin-like domain